MSTSSLNGAELSIEAFTVQAIKRLRHGGYKGIHCVYSSFNAAFREYFGPNADPVAAMEGLAKNGKIALRAAKGGAVIYLPEDAPQPYIAKKPKAKKGAPSPTLAKILGA